MKNLGVSTLYHHCITLLMDIFTNRQTVFIRYPCYICGESYSTGPYTINHIISAHNKALPRRRPGIKRPYNRDYTYQHDMNMEYDLYHHGCCSCWFHCGSYEELQEHVEREHAPNKEDYKEKTSGDVLKRSEKVGISHKSKMVGFEDDISMEQEKYEPYDKTVATTIAQQIVDLGAMLTKILKM